MPDQPDWDDDQDFTSHRDTESPPPPPSNSADLYTVPKTITPTEKHAERLVLTLANTDQQQ